MDKTYARSSCATYSRDFQDSERECCWWGGAELYVVPLFHAHLDITDEINVPANVPANAARLTMDDIRAAPKQRQAKRA